MLSGGIFFAGEDLLMVIFALIVSDIFFVLGTWTEEAISHFANAHEDEENVDVVLMDFAVDISEVKLQLDPSRMKQTMQVPNPANKG